MFSDMCHNNNVSHYELQNKCLQIAITSYIVSISVLYMTILNMKVYALIYCSFTLLRSVRML